MKSNSPAFSFYPKDWLSDSNVKAMSIDAKGAYIELLSIYWLEDGLPADTDRLSRLVGIAPAKFRRLWPLIEPCFTIKGSRLVQKRLERERAKQEANSRVQSARGKKGGRPKKSTPEKTPRLLPGIPDKSQSEPEKSLPSSFPFPSPSTDVNWKAAGEKNPLLNRASAEAEALKLCREISSAENVDGTEVIKAASLWRGKWYSNPATMSDDRLVHTLANLRERAAKATADPNSHMTPAQRRHLGQS